MKTKKLLPLILITLFLLAIPLSTIQPAKGTTIGVIAQNLGAGTQSLNIYAVHPTAGGNPSAQGQSFNATVNGTITGVEVYLYKYGSPTGYVAAAITGVAGTFGAASDSIGTFVQYSSNHVDVAGLNGDWVAYNFTFGGFDVYANGKYGFAIYAESGASMDISNNVHVRGWTNGTGLGSESQYASSGWINNVANDLVYMVYGETGPATPPTFSLSDQYNFYDEDTLVQLTGVQNATVPWIIDYNVTQGETYDFAGIVFNNSIPTGISGTLEIWRTTLYNGTADLNPVTSSYNSVYNDMNGELNQYPPTGSGYIYHDTVNVTDGTAYFDVDPIYTYGSQVSYQGYLLYYNITGNADDPYEGWLMHHWIIGAYDPVYLAGGLPTAAPTATPDQIGNYIPDPSGGAISAIVNYLVALLVILLPAGVLGVLFKFGAWGFITGMAIGSGIGYLMLFDVNGNHVVPLWLVFLIVIGTVGMLMKGYVGKGGGNEE